MDANSVQSDDEANEINSKTVGEECSEQSRTRTFSLSRSKQELLSSSFFPQVVIVLCMTL